MAKLLQVTQKLCDVVHPCWAKTWEWPWRRGRGTSPNSNPMAAKSLPERPDESALGRLGGVG